MMIDRDEKFASHVQSFFGEYMGTFTSANRQVRADLFKEGEVLVAHVSYFPGFNSENISDSYFGPIREIAKERGFETKLRIVHSDS
jgi:hypothetical protein